jgi:threonine synthase
MQKINESFIGFYTDENMTKETIKHFFADQNYLADTHTAVALSAATRYMSTCEAERKMLVVSTASPYKFAKDVYASLGGNTNIADTDAPNALSKLTETNIPKPLANLKDKSLRHPETINKDAMDNAVTSFIGA